jgi:hypothetical protein
VASRFWHAVLIAAIAVCLAGCVSMPSGGPVISYPVTQGPGAQGQGYLQMIPDPPGAGWAPSAIVQGFLAASASFADQQKTAREYLTTQASRAWNPSWSATVFGGSGPKVGPTALAGGRRGPATATVTVSGKVQASLSASGTYAVPSPASTAEQQSYTFSLVKTGGQWRISRAPDVLLLTTVEFRVDYQLRNLYFFDPDTRYLVPDPVYVPLQTTPSDLMNGLVQDLIRPPKDWLAGGATRTAFPAGTKLMSAVMLDGGTAAVNLGGSITRASDQVREQVSAQLFSTLSGSNQGQPLVQSVELFQDGKPWIPPNAQGNPVQHDSGDYSVPAGTSSQFYYLDSSGLLLRRSVAGGVVGAPVKVARIGSGYSAIAVSSDGQFLAALRNGVISIGPVGGPLTPRAGTGYTSMSWDPNDNLWATGANGIVMLHAGASAGSAAGEPVSVQVVPEGNLPQGPYTALSVAPDGVRVAVVIGSSELSFGAITVQPSGRVGQQAIIKIQLSPFYVSGKSGSFQSVTWYGPDNVITLVGSASEPELFEYPVNGGTSTRIPSQEGILSVTASFGSPLIAGAKNDALLSDASVSGSWVAIANGLAPAYPG